MLTTRSARDDRRAEDAARVRDWTREALGLAEDTLVFVTELECMEEGCPPLETVIVVASSVKDRMQYKVARPMAAVTREDLEAVLHGREDHCAH